MASQLRHNFQASQTMHGTDEATIPNFQSQVNSLSICGPQDNSLIYCRRLECPALFYLLPQHVTNRYSVPSSGELVLLNEKHRFIFKQNLLFSLSEEKKLTRLKFFSAIPVRERVSGAYLLIFRHLFKICLIKKAENINKQTFLGRSTKKILFV